MENPPPFEHSSFKKYKILAVLKFVKEPQLVKSSIALTALVAISYFGLGSASIPASSIPVEPAGIKLRRKGYDQVLLCNALIEFNILNIINTHSVRNCL